MFYMGLDIGGTKCAVSVGKVQDNRIEIVERKEVATTKNPIETISLLANDINKYKEEYSIKRVGISCGGPLDGKRGIILCPPNLLGWENFEIVKYFNDEFDLVAKLENDANACAVAEWKFGAGTGANDMVFLTFGTGLGAGLILDGKLFVGANGNAGEVGHIRLARSGPIGFGKSGSFEGFCSGGGITRLAKEMAKREKEMPSCIKEMGGLDAVSTKNLATYAKNGDKFAKKVFAKSGKMLGKGLSVIIDLFNPELIVLGGVFMRVHELLEPTMKKEIAREALAFSSQACKITPARLSESVGDVAALSLAIMED